MRILKIINNRAGGITMSELVTFQLLMQDEHLDIESVNTLISEYGFQYHDLAKAVAMTFQPKNASHDGLKAMRGKSKCHFKRGLFWSI